MKLFNNTMDQINDEDKICDIAKSFGSQIETLYANSVDEKVYFKFSILKFLNFFNKNKLVFCL